MLIDCTDFPKKCLAINFFRNYITSHLTVVEWPWAMSCIIISRTLRIKTTIKKNYLINLVRDNYHSQHIFLTYILLSIWTDWRHGEKPQSRRKTNDPQSAASLDYYLVFDSLMISASFTFFFRFRLLIADTLNWMLVYAGDCANSRSRSLATKR